jgi:hypothetical protein
VTTSYEPRDWSVERDERGHYHLIFQGTERIARVFPANGELVLRVHPPHLLPAEAAALLLRSAGVEPPGPEVVTLCGSTRFYQTWQRAIYEETMAGRIVLSVGFYPHSQGQTHSEDVGCTPEQKVALDELHKRKIDMSGSILVLDVGGYIGESTRSEVEHARSTGKLIRYWSEEHPGYQEERRA